RPRRPPRPPLFPYTPLFRSHLPRRPAWEDPAWSELSRDTHIIVASSRPDDGQAAQALAAGCSGYLHAYSPPEVLGRALESIASRSEEHTSELQSRENLVCRL